MPSVKGKSSFGNLPTPVSSLIGRQSEIAEVQQILLSNRLVTLTGPGGCGKTRLALKVAQELTEEFEEGLWLTELASLFDVSLVPQAVASTLNIRGVEYVVIAEAWDANHETPPTLMGQIFHYVGAPNRYKIPAFYELHVWAWKQNPSGMFTDWNPKVSCEQYAEDTLAQSSGH